jgi:hypothetical protein
VALDNYVVNELERIGLLSENAKGDKELMADELGDAIEVMLGRIQDGEQQTKAPRNFWAGWQGPESMAPPTYREPRNVVRDQFWKPK